MSKKQYDDDDGRQIADMSALEDTRFLPRKKTGKENGSGAVSDASSLTGKETRSVIWSALTAGLTVGLIFVAGAALLILLLLLIWSK